MSASDAAARGAREMAVAAGQLPDPVLRAGVDNLPVNGPDAWSLDRDFMTMRRIGVMQEYVSSAKRAATAGARRAGGTALGGGSGDVPRRDSHRGGDRLVRPPIRVANRAAAAGAGEEIAMQRASHRGAGRQR